MVRAGKRLTRGSVPYPIKAVVSLPGLGPSEVAQAVIFRLGVVGWAVVEGCGPGVVYVSFCVGQIIWHRCERNGRTSLDTMG